jgi:UDPglucose 6-dehydrogenase
MKITIFGSGYVGLVTAACFADVGNNVICVDVDKDKIEKLNSGVIPIFEPGLEKLIKTNKATNRLKFTYDLKKAVEFSDLFFIAVGTPQDEDGSADVSNIFSVADSIIKNIKSDKIVVTKSTVPVGTAEQLSQYFTDELFKRDISARVEVVSNPEFLKEGSAINDFMKPDRIIIGSENPKAVNLLTDLYAPFNRNHNRVMSMPCKSSELTKYVANSMLALKVSFMNEMSNIAERVGADIESVREGIGADSRIGYSFIYPGPGYGGSCFPKDIKALINTATNNSYDSLILKAVDEINNQQKNILFKKIKYHFENNLTNKLIAVWGLSFKPDTDDMRESPSINLINSLLSSGASVSVYDPEAMEECKRIFGKNDQINYSKSPLGSLNKADCLAIITEWKEFRGIDIKELGDRLNSKVLFDGRNIYDPSLMIKNGFTYYGIGRGKSIYE